MVLAVFWRNARNAPCNSGVTRRRFRAVKSLNKNHQVSAIQFASVSSATGRKGEPKPGHPTPDDALKAHPTPKSSRGRTLSARRRGTEPARKTRAAAPAVLKLLGSTVSGWDGEGDTRQPRVTRPASLNVGGRP